MLASVNIVCLSDSCVKFVLRIVVKLTAMYGRWPDLINNGLTSKKLRRVKCLSK